MSAEYAARMEVLQRRQEELTAQRQAVEKRMALREATAAEFSAVALQSYKQKWKAQRSAAIAAKKRNDEFVRSLHETQRQVHDTWSRLQGDQSSSGALLAQEKARYNRRVEQIFPAWQEQLQRQRVQKLRELEDKKRAVERRRYLAKKSFEKEQTLDDLIRKTRHEVEMAENLEQNELYERELLRTQSTHQAKEVDQSIREVALEARSYLQQQAERHLEVMPELDEELAEKLSETFSPRNTLRALREGNSSLAFEENQQYEDEEKPARQIRVEIPARMSTSRHPNYPDVSQRHPNQAYRSEETFDDDYVDEIPRRYDERPEFFDPSVTERYQTATIGSDYLTFEQSTTIAQDLLVQRDQLVGSGNMISGATFSQPAPHSEMNQQVFVGNKRRGETTREPNGKLELLPTLVTGKLDPIPEANEQVSLHGTSLMTSNAENVRNTGTQDERKSDITGISSSIPSSPAAGSTSSKSPPGLLSSTPPAKIEENRVASMPAAPIGITTPAGNTPNTPMDFDRADEGYHTAAVVPEPVIEDAMIEEPPTTSAPERRETFVQSPSMNEGKNEVLSVMSVQQSQDEVRGNTESDEASSHDEESTLGERNAVLLEKMNIARQPDEALNTVTTLSDFGSEDSLETKETGIEPVDIKRSGIVEVVKNDPVDAREFDQSRNCGSTSKIESFHDATFGSIDESLSITASHTSDAAEASVREHVESISEIVPAEVPEPVIPYSFDLLEPLSPPALKPTNAQAAEDDMLLTSMQSDDFDFSASNVQPVAEISNIVKNASPATVDSAERSASPPETLTEANTASITEKLSPVDRVKALGALISRVEEGATEGDTLGGSVDTGSSNDSKRELLKMAVGGRKAQIAFFGSDICFELIMDISRDLGPVLFPPKAFEGIMNDQKLRKLHQSNKGKQLDLWKALSGHMKQLVQLRTIPSSTLVDLFVTALLAHDPDNQRSQRKLREFLVTVCGGGGSKTPSPRKEASTTSPPPSPPKQEQRSPSPEPAKPAEPEGRIGTPALLQTAFLQRQSPPKPKVFGIASSSFKDRSSGSSDVLASMSSGPMKLSQKLMRGGKMNDYSEFEEEEEVDLQNLIGTKSTFTQGSSALGRSTYQAAKKSPTGKTAAKQAALEEEDDEFDADF